MQRQYAQAWAKDMILKVKHHPPVLFIWVKKHASICVTSSASSAVVLEGAVVVSEVRAFPLALPAGSHQPPHDLGA